MTIQALDDALAQRNTSEAQEKVLAKISPAAVKRAETNFARFQKAFPGHKSYMADAKKFNDFYMGFQWDPADLAKLKSESRPALTINKILSTINTLMGEQANRRVDVHFKPKRDATQQSAIAMSKLSMAIADQNMLDFVESEVFEDGLIMERGYFDIRMAFDENMQGDVKITSLHPMEVLPDPQMRNYDPNTWQEATTSRWLSVEEIGEIYGKQAADLIEAKIGVDGALDADSIRYDDFDEIDTLNDDDEWVPTEGLGPDEQKKIKSIRVIERQYYKLKTSYYLVDPATGVKKKLPPDTSKDEAEALAKKFQTFMNRQTERRVYWTVSADRIELFDGWSPYKTFTIVPYFPYFRRGKPMGVVRNLISPQEQYNKLSSQELHVVNSTANSGWIVEKGVLADGMTEDDLEADGAKSGIVITVNPGKKDGIEKIKPNQIPTGIIQAKESAGMSIGEISSLSSAFTGGNAQEVSGVALSNKTERGQVQIQKPLDNLQRTRMMLFRKVRELVKDFYTDERVLMMTDEFSPGAQSEELVINQRGEDGEIINDVTTGEMDIVLSTKPNRETFNDHQFAQVLNLRQAGVMIPDEWVVRYSDLHKKDELAQALAQAGQMSEEEAAIQQQQIMLSLKDMEAGVQKKMVEILHIQAMAGKVQAEAQNEMLDPEFRQADLDLRAEELQLSGQTRKELAQIQGMQNLDREMVKQRGDIIKEKLKETPNVQG